VNPLCDTCKRSSSTPARGELCFANITPSARRCSGRESIDDIEGVLLAFEEEGLGNPVGLHEIECIISTEE